MNIYFFNNFGNGDVFFNTPYISDIASQLKEHEIIYLHKKSPRLLLDKNFKSEASPFNIFQIPTPYKIIKENDNHFFNVHVGAYFDLFQDDKSFNTTLPSFHKLFTFIYHQVNQIYGTNLSIQNLEYYFSDIDYNFYRTQPIDDFFKNVSFDRKILICNGPALSGQCHGYNGDMKNIIETLANKFTNDLFLCATKFNTELNNINFCDDIIGHDLNNHNLNEVSYISTKCDIITGRNSGPLCFCSTRENMFVKRKRIIIFGSAGPMDITKNVKFDWNVSYHVILNESDILELLLTQIEI